VIWVLRRPVVNVIALAFAPPPRNFITLLLMTSPATISWRGLSIMIGLPSSAKFSTRVLSSWMWKMCFSELLRMTEAVVGFALVRSAGAFQEDFVGDVVLAARKMEGVAGVDGFDRGADRGRVVAAVTGVGAELRDAHGAEKTADFEFIDPEIDRAELARACHDWSSSYVDPPRQLPRCASVRTA